MSRFDELQTFVAVAQAGGFAAAARRLNRSAPTVTRLVAQLEARLGARLFLRTTRQVSLTEAGTRLFEDVRGLLDALDVAEAAAAGAYEMPQGLLSVTAPVMFGRLYVAPLLRGFLDAHPQVRARTLFVDRNVNLIDEGLDVALRLGDLPDSSLTAVHVGDVRRVTVASPSYLEAHGMPEDIADLDRHRLIAPTIISQAQSWVFEAGGRRTVYPIAPHMVSNTIDVCIEAAQAGWAITRVLSYQVADALADGSLVEVLAAREDRKMPVHLLHAEGPLRAAKIRAFVDHAARGLRRSAAKWAA